MCLQGEANRFAQRALVVTISSASNADVDSSRSSTILSEALPAQMALTFESAVNQVPAHAVY